ncbi:hypothetical protein GCM10010206_31490 [Streptomyces cinerochromogenes]|nr:hypothetical protein GCM10010206_31490 [Streptomyces cinerochromogenes]
MQGGWVGDNPWVVGGNPREFRPAPRAELAGLLSARGTGRSLQAAGRFRPRRLRGGAPAAGSGPRTAYLMPSLSQADLYLPVQISAAV